MSKKKALVMTILRQMLIIGVTMKRISDKNILPNKYNQKQVANEEAMNIDNDDVCEIIEEV